MKLSRIILISGLLLAASVTFTAFFILQSRSLYSNLAHQTPVNITSGQKNTLLVFVDDKGAARPQLRSIWLLLELPDKPSITLIPLYPAAINNYVIQDPKMEESFSIKDRRNLGENFIASLKELNIWWNDFILVDDFIMGSLFELTNGTVIAGKPVTGAEIRSGNYLEVATKAEQLKQQVEIMAHLCQKIPLATLHPNYQKFLAEFSSHSVTSLGDSDLAFRIDEMIHQDAPIFCEFPTISVMQNPNNTQDLN